MLSPSASVKALTALFRSHPVADVAALAATLDTTSRMSVFRRLSTVGYFSSYTHAGRYYTLRTVPRFDEDGLWCHQDICFSRQGSLKATVHYLVERAEAGRTQQELQGRLRVRVHNTLLDLVREERLGRESLGGQYVYLSPDVTCAERQLAVRRHLLEAGELPPAALISVLLELVRSAGVRLEARPIAERLRARGVAVTVDQVEGLFRLHGGKKTARSRSTPSRS